MARSVPIIAEGAIQRTSDASPIRERLRFIPDEIGKAHLAKNHELKARLCAEKALYLELLQPAGGTRELLAQAQKDAADALEKVADKKGALKFYRKAFDNRARIIKYLVGRESTIRGHREDIARLKGILAGNPDKATREKLETELRLLGLLLPNETLRYEVDVGEVRKIIAQLERQKRGAEREAEFIQAQLKRVTRDLERLQAKIKHLEEELAKA